MKHEHEQVTCSLENVWMKHSSGSTCRECIYTRLLLVDLVYTCPPPIFLVHIHFHPVDYVHVPFLPTYYD